MLKYLEEGKEILEKKKSYSWISCVVGYLDHHPRWRSLGSLAATVGDEEEEDCLIAERFGTSSKNLEREKRE